MKPNRQPLQISFKIAIVLLVLSSQACLFSKKHSDSAPANTYSISDGASCDDKITADFVKPGATQVVPYRINSVMLDPVTGATICTPRAIRQKIKDVLDLYASIPEAGFTFRYIGPDTIDYSTGAYDPMNRPSYFDGALDIILSGNDSGFDGYGSADNIWGRAHSGYFNNTNSNFYTYQGGFADLILHDTAGHQSPGAISFGLLLHEIGHALGLNHIPIRGANMSRYNGGFAGDYYGFSEQERADLASILPATGKTIYQISGTVVTGYTGNGTASGVLGGTADVYAVDVTNGRTYAGLGSGTGTTVSFFINILHPGTYRIVAIPDGYPGMGFDPSARQASWWVNNTTATNDPTGGTTITVNDSTPTQSGVAIQMISAPAAYYLNGTAMQRDLSNPDFNVGYITPGTSGAFEFWVLCGGASSVAHCDPVTALEPYGTAPDYSFSNLTVTTDASPVGAFYSVRVTTNANAAPGGRIAIGRAASGIVQVFAPISILKPGTVPQKPNFTSQQQIQGYQDFTTFNPTWYY